MLDKNLQALRRARGLTQEQTAAAVRAFCIQAGLPAGEDVTGKVWSTLVDASYFLGDRTLYLRMPHFHGHDVLELQHALGALGFACGATDGIFGAFTELALRKFQLNLGLPSDGIAGAYTYAAIRNLHHSWEGKEAVHGSSHLGFARAADVLERFSRRFPVLIAGGVGLILLDVIMLIGLSPEDSSLDLVRGVRLDELIVAPFMFVLAVAVGTLIWATMQKSKYELSELTYIAHRQNLGADLPPTAVVKSPEQVRAERVMGVICGCIMLLALIVFLVWGFVPLFDQIGGWDGIDKFALKDAIRRGAGGFAISWIAFVVGGILCGIVWMIGSVVSKTQEDWIAEARQEDAWVKYAQQDDPWSRGPEDPASSQTPTPSSAPREANDPAGRTWKH